MEKLTVLKAPTDDNTCSTDKVTLYKYLCYYFYYHYIRISRPKLQKLHLMEVVSIAIRCTYYEFCRRNKSWPNPELLDFQLFYSIFLSVISYSC